MFHVCADRSGTYLSFLSYFPLSKLNYERLRFREDYFHFVVKGWKKMSMSSFRHLRFVLFLAETLGLTVSSSVALLLRIILWFLLVGVVE